MCKKIKTGIINTTAFLNNKIASTIDSHTFKFRKIRHGPYKFWVSTRPSLLVDFEVEELKIENICLEFKTNDLVIFNFLKTFLHSPWSTINTYATSKII